MCVDDFSDTFSGSNQQVHILFIYYLKTLLHIYYIF